MATGGLYGNASESVGLYGNTTNFGGSYFEWFIFYQSDTQPATPTGGSWSFTTNTGTPPTGWSVVPFPAPTLPVWVSIALVNSRSDVPLVWSAPGLFSYSSGLPILSGSGTPAVGDGINSQLYVQTSTTPQTIWFKQSGTWNRLVGSTLYADLTTNQTVAGIKTFSSPIVGSVTGTAANVTGIVPIVNGGTGSTTANGAFNALAPSQTSQAGKYLTTDGTNTSWGTNPLGTVTSVDVSGGTTGLTTSGGPVTTSGTITLAGTLAVANGGTGATTAGVALTNLGAVGTIASADASIVVTQVGSSVDLSVSTTSPASVLLEQVRNTTGATLTKGTAVYISGATGQIPTVSKALATSDATSAQTLGLITADISNNSNGYVTIIGLIANLNTSAYTDGQQLYLSPITAGTLTATKPYAPQHLVYMAVVAHAHPTQGKLLVKVQNGYELDELHNVAAQSPTTGQTIVWNSATSLWEKNTVSLTVGVNGTLPILNGGTGQTTANGAFNALAPSQTGNSGKYLTTDGSNTSWAANPLGTVTSVAASVPSFLSIAGSPITTSGTLAFTLSGTALPTTSGGTGLTSFTSGGVVYASSTSALATGSALTFDGVTFSTTAKIYSAGSSTSATYFQRSIAPATESGTETAIVTTGNGDNQRAGLFASNNYASNLTTELIFKTNASTGSASEGMRLTSSSLYTASGINVGIGTSNPAALLDVNGTARVLNGLVIVGANTSLYAADGTLSRYNTTNNGVYLNGNAGGFLALQASGAQQTYINLYGNTASTPNVIDFVTSASGRLRIASAGNVGINQTDPLAKLHVIGDQIRHSNTTNISYYGTFEHDAVTTGANIYNCQDTGGHLFKNSGTTVVTIANGGNVGIGEAPNASWATVGPVIQFPAGGFVAAQGSTNTFYVGSNHYFDGGSFRYSQTGFATQYQCGGGDGSHSWRATSVSGSGGAIATIGTLMVLNNAGNLGIGETSPAARLDLKSSATDFTGVILNNTSTNGKKYNIVSAGSGSYFDIPAGAFGIRDLTASATRLVIDTSGNLLVGTSTNANAYRQVLSFSGDTTGGLDFLDTFSSAGTTVACAFRRAGSAVGSIQTTLSLTLYNTTSDYRLKNVVGAVTGHGERIDALEPIEYTWKSNGLRTRGFLAHKFQEVYADSVSGTKDAVDANGKPVYQGMQAGTAEVIADLVAEIKSLRQRLSAANL